MKKIKLLMLIFLTMLSCSSDDVDTTDNIVNPINPNQPEFVIVETDLDNGYFDENVFYTKLNGNLCASCNEYEYVYIFSNSKVNYKMSRICTYYGCNIYPFGIWTGYLDITSVKVFNKKDINNNLINDDEYPFYLVKYKKHPNQIKTLKIKDGFIQ
jgi:hypothetical protein